MNILKKFFKTKIKEDFEPSLSDLYNSYPVKPYVSPHIDWNELNNMAMSFPSVVIPKETMTPYKNGLLKGDIILLWLYNGRLEDHLPPGYFEYKYGINFEAHLLQVQKLGFLKKKSYYESLPKHKNDFLKNLLVAKGVSNSGNKKELVAKIIANYSIDELASLNIARVLVVTETGSEILKKFDDVIDFHMRPNREEDDRITSSVINNDFKLDIENVGSHELRIARELENHERIPEAVSIYKAAIQQQCTLQQPYDKMYEYYVKNDEPQEAELVLKKIVFIFENVVYEKRADRDTKLKRYQSMLEAHHKRFN